jgi:hypothetical protein
MSESSAQLRTAADADVTQPAGAGGAGPEYAMGLLDGSYEWYRRAAIRSRRNYKVSETVLLVVAAGIPTSAVLVQKSGTVPAILGALVVVLTGLRSIFHWQDNYLRFSAAREALEAERRSYNTRATPYDDEAARDQILAASVSRIERAEMGGWLQVAAPRPKP